MVVVAVAILLLGELGARALSDRLPEPLTWYHPVAQVKVEQMDALRAAGTSTDVVFAGTSQMAIGADPVRFTQLVATHPSTYNAALLAGYPAANRRFVLEEIVPRLHPRTIVYGVSSEDLQAGPEAPYDQALATEPGVLGSVDRWASSHSELIRHRHDLRDPTVLSYALTIGNGGGELEHYRSSVIGPAGSWNFPSATRCQPVGGVQPVRPDTPATFTPDADRGGNVWATIDALRAQGIEVVLAVMPFADCYVDWFNRGASDAAGRAAIAEGGRQRGLRVIDVAAEVHQDDLFGDPGHLNAAGRQRYTELLAAAWPAAGR